MVGTLVMWTVNEDEDAGEQPPTNSGEGTTFGKKNAVILFVLSSVVAVLLLSSLMVSQREHDAFDLEEEANDVGDIYTSWNEIWERRQSAFNFAERIVDCTRTVRHFPRPCSAARTDTIKNYNGLNSLKSNQRFRVLYDCLC